MPFPRLRSRPAWQQDLGIAITTWLAGMALFLTRPDGLFFGAAHGGLGPRVAELTVLSAAQLLRRRVPLGLLPATAILVVDFLQVPSLPILVVYTDFLYSATLYGSRRAARVMIGVAITATVAVLVLLFTWRSAGFDALGLLPFVLTPIWWAANVRQQRDVAETERANAGQLARIAELDRTAAVTAERSRMARDLHDVIAGHLSAIAIQSEAALSMSDADPKLSRTVLAAVRENSVDALEEMRAMIGLLRADGGEPEVTAPARLADLAKLLDSARAGGLDVVLKSTVDTERLPAAVDLTAYRIAQEALTNAVKHAPGARAAVDIRRTGGILTIEVTNDAGHSPAANTPQGTGIGLLNMRERAHAVGGTLSAGPAGTGGWLVRAELPVSEGLT